MEQDQEFEFYGKPDGETWLLAKFVSALAEAVDFGNKLGVIIRYCCNDRRNLTTNEIVLSIFRNLPHPCPRRRRGYECKRIIAEILDITEMSQTEVEELERVYVRFLGPNGWDTSVTSHDILTLFEDFVKVDTDFLDKFCASVRKDFNLLSSDDKLFWESTKWQMGLVPRPQFCIQLLLMTTVITLGNENSEQTVSIDNDKMTTFLTELGLENERKYIRSHLTPQKVWKVANHGCNSNAENNNPIVKLNVLPPAPMSLVEIEEAKRLYKGLLAGT